MVDRAMTVSEASAASTWIESLFVAHEHRLGQFLRQMVRDRALADDLVQETFLAAFREHDRVGPIDDPAPWLFGIARNRALASLRRTRRMRRAIERLGSRSHAVAPIETNLQEIMDMLDRSLGADDRSLVLLRYVHGFDASQLAELTGRSPAAIRKRLERACAKLAREIET
jgi:RNA polymerase sigma-70 factor (ECF subfamily)